MEVNTDDYFTYDARLASFKTAHKRRGSARGKAMKWPHAHLKAEAVSSLPLHIHSPVHNPRLLGAYPVPGSSPLRTILPSP